MTGTGLPFVPVGEPEVGAEERAYLLDCLDTGWVSGEGPYVARFETGVAERVGRAHGIAVASGSAALDLAFAALDLAPGDEVILPTLTIISCATAILRAGATPVTVDCDPGTWNMRPEDVAPSITARTRAILIVHIYGLPVDADPILELAKRHGLFVVEDAAEAIGQTYRGRACGSLGSISIFSFFSNKNVTTGEGGMVVTDDDGLAARCRDLRNLCFSGRRRFLHEDTGWSWRMSNLQAAFGCGQLVRLDEVCVRKRKIGRLYTDRLKNVRDLQIPVAETDFAKNDYWVFGIVLSETFDFDAEEVIRRLALSRIGARPFFWPIHAQPVFKRSGLFKDTRHPNAERAASRGLYLPSSVRLTEPVIERVCDTLCEVLR